ncbi:hypothetical protein OHS33_36985 [Streptomyces sp. NBC_00536]|uniref:hypothetical protein n=1 Tax=Streptomyces sp. NBC_00536 TaxID=2975769 RepID=UPI002E807046|nr:hypothetical protein [Streptomyces sp. NBC_00536]WUC83466.1 hypothetical protein OHS33_36985 [Streptomyces sp. NBC_00536]
MTTPESEASPYQQVLARALLADGGGAVRTAFEEESLLLRCRAAAGRLRLVLTTRQVEADVRGDAAGQVTVEITDVADLPSAVNFARAFGTPVPAAFLSLDLVEDLYAFGDRLQLLLTGALGPGVRVVSVPGSEDSSSRIEVGLTVPQALILAGRLT